MSSWKTEVSTKHNGQSSWAGNGLRFEKCAPPTHSLGYGRPREFRISLPPSVIDSCVRSRNRMTAHYRQPSRSMRSCKEKARHKRKVIDKETELSLVASPVRWAVECET